MKLFGKSDETTNSGSLWSRLTKPQKKQDKKAVSGINNNNKSDKKSSSISVSRGPIKSPKQQQKQQPPPPKIRISNDTDYDDSGDGSAGTNGNYKFYNNIKNSGLLSIVGNGNGNGNGRTNSSSNNKSKPSAIVTESGHFRLSLQSLSNNSSKEPSSNHHLSSSYLYSNCSPRRQAIIGSISGVGAEQLEARLKTSKHQCEQLKRKVANLSLECQRLENQTKELKDIKDQLLSFQTDLSMLKRKDKVAAEIQQRISHLEEENYQMRTHIDKLRIKIKEISVHIDPDIINKRLETLEAENSQLTSISLQNRRNHEAFSLDVGNQLVETFITQQTIYDEFRRLQHRLMSVERQNQIMSDLIHLHCHSSMSLSGCSGANRQSSVGGGGGADPPLQMIATSAASTVVSMSNSSNDRLGILLSSTSSSSATAAAAAASSLPIIDSSAASATVTLISTSTAITSTLSNKTSTPSVSVSSSTRPVISSRIDAAAASDASASESVSASSTDPATVVVASAVDISQQKDVECSTSVYSLHRPTVPECRRKCISNIMNRADSDCICSDQEGSSIQSNTSNRKIKDNCVVDYYKIDFSPYDVGGSLSTLPTRRSNGGPAEEDPSESYQGSTHHLVCTSPSSLTDSSFAEDSIPSNVLDSSCCHVEQCCHRSSCCGGGGVGGGGGGSNVNKLNKIINRNNSSDNSSSVTNYLDSSSGTIQAIIESSDVVKRDKTIKNTNSSSNHNATAAAAISSSSCCYENSSPSSQRDDGYFSTSTNRTMMVSCESSSTAAIITRSPSSRCSGALPYVFQDKKKRYMILACHLQKSRCCVNRKISSLMSDCDETAQNINNSSISSSSSVTPQCRQELVVGLSMDLETGIWTRNLRRRQKKQRETLLSVITSSQMSTTKNTETVTKATTTTTTTTAPDTFNLSSSVKLRNSSQDTFSNVDDDDNDNNDDDDAEDEEDDIYNFNEDDDSSVLIFSDTELFGTRFCIDSDLDEEDDYSRDPRIVQYVGNNGKLGSHRCVGSPTFTTSRLPQSVDRLFMLPRSTAATKFNYSLNSSSSSSNNSAAANVATNNNNNNNNNNSNLCTLNNNNIASTPATAGIVLRSFGFPGSNRKLENRPRSALPPLIENPSASSSDGERRKVEIKSRHKRPPSATSIGKSKLIPPRVRPSSMSAATTLISAHSKPPKPTHHQQQQTPPPRLSHHHTKTSASNRKSLSPSFLSNRDNNKSFSSTSTSINQSRSHQESNSPPPVPPRPKRKSFLPTITSNNSSTNSPSSSFIDYANDSIISKVQLQRNNSLTNCSGGGGGGGGSGSSTTSSTSTISSSPSGSQTKSTPQYHHHHHHHHHHSPVNSINPVRSISSSKLPTRTTNDATYHFQEDDDEYYDTDFISQLESYQLPSSCVNMVVMQHFK